MFHYIIFAAALACAAALAAPVAHAASWYLVGAHYHTTTDVDFSHDPGSHRPEDSYDPEGIRDLEELGARLGLDAMVVTEHNSVATCFDPLFASRRLTFICGEEWTAKKSLHLGIFNPPVRGARDSYFPENPGEVRPREVVERDARDLVAAVRAAAREEGRPSLVVVNHPGYRMYQPSDSLGAQAAEVLVPDYEYPSRARRWWLERLARGERIVALAGADFHACSGWDCMKRGDLFRRFFAEPLNLVLAHSAGVAELMEAMARGRVVAVAGPRYRGLRVDWEASFDGRWYGMGDRVPSVAPGDTVELEGRIRNAGGLHAAVFKVANPAALLRRFDVEEDEVRFSLRHRKVLDREAVHVELFEQGEGLPVAVGNPIYF